MGTVVPNKIKSTLGAEPDTISVGNFRIGTSSGGQYAPTSTTDFWQGISPPVGGYTVYEDTGTRYPSIHTPQDDAALIWYAGYLGANSVTTIEEALYYFTQQADKKCVNIDYPDIVTSGLTNLYDFGYVASCSRFGNTVYDISQNQTVASLSYATCCTQPNPFVFSGSNGQLSFMSFGADNFNPLLSFTGPQDYEFTVSFLVNPSDGETYPVELLSPSSYKAKIQIGKNFNFFINDTLLTTNLSQDPQNKWTFVTASYSTYTGRMKLYTDGFLRVTKTISTGLGVGNNFNSSLGFYPEEIQTSGKMLVMNMMMHSRELSQDDVARNFSAYSSRYGVPEIKYAMDGLKVCLDASDPRSGISGTWKDLAYTDPAVKMYDMAGFTRTSSYGGIYTNNTPTESASAITSSYRLEQGFSVEVVALLENIYSGTTPSIFCEIPDGAGNSNFAIYVDPADFKIKGRVGRAGNSQVVDSGIVLSGDLSWRQLVFTFDGDRYGFYNNSQLVAAQAVVVSPNASLSGYRIGGSYAYGSTPGNDGVKMKLSVIRVYERALNEQEIRRNFNDDIGRLS